MRILLLVLLLVFYQGECRAGKSKNTASSTQYSSFVISPKTIAQIIEHLDPAFIYHGCNGTLIRKDFAETIVKLSNSTSFFIEIINTTNIGDGLSKIRVDVFGLETTPVHIELVLVSKGRKFKNATRTSCQPPKEVLTESALLFLNRVSDAINSKNLSATSDFLSPTFEIEWCGRHWHKTGAIEILGSLKTPKVKFALHTVVNASSNSMTVIVMGLSSSVVEAEFVVNLAKKQIQHITVLNCAPSTPPDLPEPSVPGPHPEAPEPPVIPAVKKVLETASQALRTKNMTMLATVFGEEFDFKTCEGMRGEKLLFEFIKNTTEPLNPVFRSLNETEKFIDIHTTVLYNGVNEIHCVMNKASGLLVLCHISNCPNTNKTEEKPTVTIEKWIVKLEAAGNSGKMDLVQAVLTEDFLLKGCTRDFNSTQFSWSYANRPVFHFKIFETKETPAQIFGTALAIATGLDELLIAFVFNKEQGKMEHVRILVCNKKR